MKLSKTSIPGVYVLSGASHIEQVGDGVFLLHPTKTGSIKGGKRGRPKGSKNNKAEETSTQKKPKASKKAPKATASAPATPA